MVVQIPAVGAGACVRMQSRLLKRQRADLYVDVGVLTLRSQLSFLIAAGSPLLDNLRKP